MNASIWPEDTARNHEESARQQLVEKLAAGESTPEDFMLGVQQLSLTDPEAGWGVLALINQYFRRRLITPPVFVAVKKRLEQHNLGSPETPAPALEEESLPTVHPPEPLATPVSSSAPVTSTAPPAWRAGELIRGRYRITEVLSRSSSEILLEAADEIRAGVQGVRQRVAMQVLIEPPAQQQAVMQRLCRLQSLSHPHIERIFDIDAEPGALFLTREHLDGRTLTALVAQAPVPLAPSVMQSILASVADALSYAHAHDVLHCAVDAHNVFITSSGEVRLTGFALRCSDIATVGTDHLAFARLAYELLSGSLVPHRSLHAERDSARLHAPPGLTRAQWRVLRDTLTGKARGPANDVLRMFGAHDAAANAALLPGVPVAPARSRSNSSGWIAAGLVASVLAAATYLVVTHDPDAMQGSVEPAVMLSVTTPSPDAAVAAAATASDPVPVASKATARIPPPVAPARQPAFARAQLDLPARVTSVDGSLPVARIWVRRQGNLQGEVTFLWWTESGTAEVDTDFREIAPRMATIADGARGVELLVPLVPNAERRMSRAFYVKIDSPGVGASIGQRNLMQVQIVPPSTDAAAQPAF